MKINYFAVSIFTSLSLFIFFLVFFLIPSEEERWFKLREALPQKPTFYPVITIEHLYDDQYLYFVSEEEYQKIYMSFSSKEITYRKALFNANKDQKKFDTKCYPEVEILNPYMIEYDLAFPYGPWTDPYDFYITVWDKETFSLKKLSLKDWEKENISSNKSPYGWNYWVPIRVPYWIHDYGSFDEYNYAPDSIKQKFIERYEKSRDLFFSIYPKGLIRCERSKEYISWLKKNEYAPAYEERSEYINKMLEDSRIENMEYSEKLKKLLYEAKRKIDISDAITKGFSEAFSEDSSFENKRKKEIEMKKLENLSIEQNKLEAEIRRIRNIIEEIN